MKPKLPKVLHVDDEEDIREVTRLALETVGGFDLVQCDSGRQALEIALETQPDLFLLDLMMPDLDGIQTLKRLRDIPGFERTPAFFMTARASEMDERILLKNGGAAVIPKPFDPLRLSQEIVDLWRSQMSEGPEPETDIAC